MKLEGLNIVSLDVPFPPNYGGVIDIYYRAKALKAQGIKIILHCFEYGRGQNHNYHEIADEIFYYSRSTSFFKNISFLPFIVNTRTNNLLVQNLLKNNFPILLEGQHCTAILSEKALENRFRFVRIHNIEWQYYEGLAKATTSWWQKIFFKFESFKLKYHETVFKNANALFCLTSADVSYYKSINSNVFMLPIGCDFQMKNKATKTEEFALFQGNLSVAENEKAIRWIVETWLSEAINYPLVIAGKAPNAALSIYLQKFDFIQTYYNPSAEKMNDLISKAHVNLLITFQNTGIKLKLINALVSGNHCIANNVMVDNTGFESFCEICTSDTDIKNIIAAIKNTTPKMYDERILYLNQYYNPTTNAIQLIAAIESLINTKN